MLYHADRLHQNQINIIRNYPHSRAFADRLCFVAKHDIKKEEIMPNANIAVFNF